MRKFLLAALLAMVVAAPAVCRDQAPPSPSPPSPSRINGIRPLACKLTGAGPVNGQELELNMDDLRYPIGRFQPSPQAQPKTVPRTSPSFASCLIA